MSVPAGTEQVTGAPVTEAQKNAADEVDKHTPETPPVAPPPESVANTADGSDGIKELREQVGTLGETVDTLAKVVNSLIGSASGSERDESVAKLPLLLRGKKDLD